MEGYNGLTHLDPSGRARMVDVGGKRQTAREAVARGEVYMDSRTLDKILAGETPKGDVLAAARIAGIMAAKKTSELIPLCHPLFLTSVSVDLVVDRERSRVRIEGRARTTGQTGVEMEALTAVSVAALTVYDMLKAVDRGMVISDIRLVSKTGGKSGTYLREGEDG